MAVDFQRADYEKALPNWEMVSDACAGEDAVKERDRVKVTATGVQVTFAQKRYLPMPNPHDLSQANLLRYQQYLQRAVYTNYTGYTLAGLVGLAFKRPPEVDVEGVDYLLDDASGSGVSLFQQMQNTTESVLQKGRHGLWVDYPTTPGGASRADMDSGMVRANIISYQPEQVINWRTEKVGAAVRLALVVIRECVEEVAEDGYSTEEVEQYRVLRLSNLRYVQTESGIEAVEASTNAYSVEVYRATDGGFDLVDATTPVDGAGNTWDTIPFVFVGATDNDTSIDKAPLYDMAVVNLAHYRNSADEEDAGFFMGQVQPVIIGLDEAWRDWLQEKEIYVGSRSPIPLPEGGDMKLLQSSENTMIERMKEDKQQQIVAIGARLIQPGQATKTATEAQNDREAEHSILSLVVENVSEAYTQCVMWCAQYMNVSGDKWVSVNREFMDLALDPVMLGAIVAAWQGGAIPKTDVFGYLRRVGLIDPDKTDDDIEAELESDPAGLGLDAIPPTD